MLSCGFFVCFIGYVSCVSIVVNDANEVFAKCRIEIIAAAAAAVGIINRVLLVPSTLVFVAVIVFLNLLECWRSFSACSFIFFFPFFFLFLILFAFSLWYRELFLRLITRICSLMHILGNQSANKIIFWFEMAKERGERERDRERAREKKSKQLRMKICCDAWNHHRFSLFSSLLLILRIEAYINCIEKFHSMWFVSRKAGGDGKKEIVVCVCVCNRQHCI